MAGNVVVWKPADTQIYSAQVLMEVFEEAGLPPGVINMVLGVEEAFSEIVLSHPDLSGIHFTGSTKTFQHFWKVVGNGIDRYKTYPRIVGETGGKDFLIAHPSADVPALATALIRGAFEYQGQKCSAASRAYIPRSIWNQVSQLMLKDFQSIRVGPVEDFSCFVNAVIDKRSFDRIQGFLSYARESNECEFLFGGNSDDTSGFFVDPTVIVTTNPKFRTMQEEIFGPVLTVYVFEDENWEKTLELVDSTSPYALTGAVFSKDRYAVEQALETLRNSAGNFYINDKPTGAVVGQQPFGGSRASGTNDKAGSRQNLLRWISARTIKENFVPPSDYRYPFMG
jgi:1-pyrroline-5-carboxylate dehydrogenase